jgi:hypothetical protein
MLSFADFGKVLQRVSTGALLLRESLALDAIGEMLVETAQARVGSSPETAPGPIGPFPGWAPLAPSTVARKGFENILFETGTFQQDISYRVEPWKVTFGTHQDYIVYTELGTSRMPPRPVFGPTLLDRIPEILPMIGEAFLLAFEDASVMKAGVARGYVRAGLMTEAGTSYAGELVRLGPDMAQLR